ncbi:hypothetical protein V8C42DRAFT_42122 [Trichoderma barbatum]
MKRLTYAGRLASWLGSAWTRGQGHVSTLCILAMTPFWTGTAALVHPWLEGPVGSATATQPNSLLELMMTARMAPKKQSPLRNLNDSYMVWVCKRSGRCWTREEGGKHC